MSAVSSAAKPPLSLPLRLNLSVMMFLQFGIWGAWFVVFFPYLRGLNFTGEQAGALMGNMALGAIFSTIFAGYVATKRGLPIDKLVIASLRMNDKGYELCSLEEADEFAKKRNKKSPT